MAGKTKLILQAYGETLIVYWIGPRLSLLTEHQITTCPFYKGASLPKFDENKAQWGTPLARHRESWRLVFILPLWISEKRAQHCDDQSPKWRGEQPGRRRLGRFVSKSDFWNKFGSGIVRWWRKTDMKEKAVDGCETSNLNFLPHFCRLS